MSDKAKVDKFGQMGPCTRVGGRTTKPMEKEDLFMLTVMSMMVNGLTTKHTALEFIAIWTELSTKATGKRINNMVMVWRHGQMVQNMRANTYKEKNTESEDSHGLMALPIMVSLLKTIFREKVNIIGLTVENMMVFG